MAQGDQVAVLEAGSISYLDVGPSDGAPLVYFHGTPSCRREVTPDLVTWASERGVRILAPDRPGCGGSAFIRYDVGGYAEVVRQFLDGLDVGETALLGVSGGGRYACAVAAALPERCRQLVLLASTASPDMPGVRESWSKQDRQMYRLAGAFPLVLRAYLARVARKAARDPGIVPTLFNDLSPVDQQVLERPELLALMASLFEETFRNGTHGAAYDIKLEGRPWGIDLGRIEAPTQIWHGTADTIVGPRHAEVLAARIKGSELHLLEGQGHLSMRVDKVSEILRGLA